MGIEVSTQHVALPHTDGMQYVAFIANHTIHLMHYIKNDFLGCWGSLNILVTKKYTYEKDFSIPDLFLAGFFVCTV